MKGIKRALSCVLALLLSLSLFPASAPSPAAEAAETAYIVKYRDSALRPAGEGSSVPFDVVGETEMRRLLRAGLLEWAEPDGELLLSDAELTETISPFYGDECWNLTMIGADAAFERELLGQGVRVGVLDSGIDPHPDLAERLQPGHNYMINAEDRNDTADHYGHGTRVAGLIAAAGEDGYLGVAPGAELVPLKVTDGSGVKVSVICEAIYGGVDDYGCRVLNLSMGVSTDYQSLREAVSYAEEKGVVVVSAVGNNGTAAIYYPACYETVIGVGAVSRDGNVYYHSNRNESVFLTAPGAGLQSTASAGGYASASGTSFAVPHVSGAAAVLLGADPSLTPADVRSLLAESASDRGAEGYDTAYGCGVLDLGAAVTALEAGGPEPQPSELLRPCAFLPEEGPAAAVRNETDRTLRCTYLLASYDESGVCLSVSVRQLTLLPGESAELEAPQGEGPFAQFLCDAETLRPLAAERRSP